LCDTHCYGDPDGYSHCNPYLNRHRYGNSNSYSYCHGDGHINTNTDGYPNPSWPPRVLRTLCDLWLREGR
jgi:hypothetical protein